MKKRRKCNPFLLIFMMIGYLMLVGRTTMVSVNAAEEKFTSGDWTYTLSSNQATIVDYSGNETTVNIPSSLGGYPVTAIGNAAFMDCTSIVQAYIPETVTTLGYNVFYNTSITEIIIPKSITYCSASSSNTNSYSTGPFGGAGKLRKVIFEEGMTDIPDNVLNFGSTNSVLTTVDIPDTVQTIGKHAFQYCKSLSNVVLPKNLTSVGEDAFFHCESLQSVVFSENDSAEVEVGSWAFSYCGSLNNVHLSQNITSIGACAFWDCENLTALELPESLTTLGYRFISGSGITEITIPKNVISCSRVYSSGVYYSGPLGGASKLKKVIFQDGMSAIPANILACTSTEMTVDSVVIPDSVCSIGDNAFLDCTSITSISLPQSVRSIGSKAFRGCTGLEKIVFEEGDTEDESSVSIGQYAFYGCTSLKEVGVARFGDIGTYAFGNCAGITEVHLGNCVTSIGASAFRNCSNLKAVTFGDSTVYSKTHTSGERVVTGNSLKSIGDYAFYECTSLSGTLAFPSTLKSIGTNAFYKCSGINRMYFAGDFPSIGTNAFYGLAAEGFYRDNNTSWTTVHTNTSNSIYQYGGSITWTVWQDFWLIRNNSNYCSTSELGYYMNHSDYNRLTNSLTSRADIFNIMFGLNQSLKLTHKINVDGQYEDFVKWGGYCYGLSTLSVLVNDGVVSPSDIYEDTDYLYDLSSENAVDSVINFYSSQQLLSSMRKRMKEYLPKDNKTKIEQLENDVDSGVALILYEWRNVEKNAERGHAVTAYGREDGSWTKNGETYLHRIIIYDCSHPNNEDSYLYYNDDGKWYIPIVKAASVTPILSSEESDNARLSLTIADPVAINCVDYKTGVSNQDSDVLPDNDIYMFTKNKELMVSADNTAFTYDRLNTQMKKGKGVNAWIMPNATADDTDTNQTVISIPKGKYCEVVSEKEGLEVEVTDDNEVQWAMTEKPATVCFDLDKEVTLDCSEATNFQIGMMTTNLSKLKGDQFEIYGESTAPISFALTDSGLEIKGDDLTDLKIMVTENDTKKTISLVTDNDSILISDNENGGLAAKGKNNDEMEYSNDLINTESCSHDYQMTDIKNATATQPGLRMNICSLCHKRDKESQEVISPTNNLSDCEIKLSAESFEYEGVPVEPCVELYDGDYLVNSNAYKVTYIDNNIIGNEAKVRVNGIDGYTGQTEKCFSIVHTDHKWDAGVVTKKATCTSTGEKVYTCQICHETKTEVLPKTAHTKTTVYGYAATCTRTGKTNGVKCSACGSVLQAQKTIPVTHKVKKWKTLKKATVLKTGKRTGKCSICKKTVTQTIPKVASTIKVASKVSVKCKKSKTIKVTYKKGDGIKSWTSSNKSVATVTKKGKVTGKKKGTATLTVKLKSGKTAKVVVTVQ